MGKYTRVKSKFIKEKIKKTKWEDSCYIDDLIKIENIILGEVHGWTIGYLRNHLEEEYPKEYKAIYKELRPKEWKTTKNQKRKEKEKEKKEEKIKEERYRKEEERDKKDWIKAGGKI
jgi:hypothetical protein